MRNKLRINGRTVAGIAIVLLLVAAFKSRREIRLWYGPGAEPEVVSFDDADKEMNSAIETARRTASTFIEALNHPGPARSNFSIKLGVREKNEVEHFWLRDVKHRGNMFTGTIANTPKSVHSVRLGQEMSVSTTQISDWMYIESGVLQGNFTMRVMRNRLTPEERSKFDSQLGFRIK
jgi:uncharacterized protein YegJ (DUF2314 family)